MPTYDVRCRACGVTFEINRSMAHADDPAPCPAGHQDTVRLLPTVAVTGRAGAAGRSSRTTSTGVTDRGGCCGGGGCCA